MLILGTVYSVPALAQTTSERCWLAGCYDGNRIVVYFDAVKFGDTFPSNAVEIAPPVAAGFWPFSLPAGYIARFQKGPGAEHFAVGDRKDLLLGGDEVVTITLTTLIASPGDEQVGNDSYIGALGTLDRGFGLPFQKDYYGVRRHREAGNNSKATSDQPSRNARLVDEPVRFDIQREVASQLNQWMKTAAEGSVRLTAATIVPAFAIQPFTLADGSLRYYVRAEWKSGEEPNGNATYVLAAWMATEPSVRVLAVEHQTSPYGFEHELPLLLNVVDLGKGKTGLIISINGEDSAWLKLLEYRDGVDLNHMPKLQSIGSAE